MSFGVLFHAPSKYAKYYQILTIIRPKSLLAIIVVHTSDIHSPAYFATAVVDY